MIYYQNELSIIIPFYCDSKDRLENLNMVLDYLNSFMKCQIIVAEQMKGNTPHFSYNRGYSNVEIFRVQYDYSYFHKTRLINDAFKARVKNSIFMMHDCDAIFFPQDIDDMTTCIHNNTFSFTYPYNRMIVFVPRDRINKFKYDNDIYHIKVNDLTFTLPETPACGLGFICNSSLFCKVGKMNENFHLWGEEDWELYYRIQKLNYNWGIGNNFAFHIEHFRTKDGTDENCCIIENRFELDKVKNMSKERLVEYVSTWK